MKKVLFFLLFGFLIKDFGSAQTKTEYENFNITRTEIRKKNPHFFELAYVGTDSGCYYGLSIPESQFIKNVLEKKLKQYRVFRVDSSLNYTAVELPSKIEGKKVTTEFMLKLKDDFYVFSSFNNRKHKKNYLFAQKINKQTLTVLPEAKMVAEVDYSDFSDYKNTSFNYVYSADSSKVLISHNLTNKDKIILKMGMTLFDDGLNKQWHTDKIPIPEEGFFTIDQIEVCKNGDLFLLGKLNDNKREMKQQIGYLNYTYRAVLLYDNGQKAAHFPLTIPDNWVYRLSCILSKDDNILHCVGIYVSSETSKIAGVCSFNIDKNRKAISKQNLTPFNSDLPLAKHIIEREKPTGEKIFSTIGLVSYYHFYFFIRKPIMDKDGSFWMITEKVKEEPHFNNSIIPAFKDLYVTKFDSTGNVSWTSRIEKSLSVYPGEFNVGSYNAHPINGKLNLIYTSEKTNKKHTIEKALKHINVGIESVGGRKFYVTTLSENGEVHEAIFSAIKQDKTMLKDSGMGYFSENSLFGYENFGEGYKKYRFFKIDFK